MEDIFFQIYGTFVLTLAGFVLPILAIVISLFPEGFSLLKETYRNQREQAEGNLEAEMKKKKLGKDLDYEIIEKNVATLKKEKKKAETRLLYLNPQYFLSRSVLYLGLSLTSLFISIIIYDNTFGSSILLLIISLIFLVLTIVIFSNSITIIIEASAVVQGVKRTFDEKTLELLTTLVDNSKQGDASLFINPEKIKVYFNEELLTEDSKYTFSVNNKHSIAISLNNNSDYMFKTAELGFTFPEEFLVEGERITSTYTSTKQKIIRFNHNHVQSHENMVEGDIDITILKVGTYKIDMFVKGENLKRKIIKFEITAVD